MSSPADIVFKQFTEDLMPLFTPIEWAEDEIARAQARHRRKRNALYHSFMLLTPTHARMRQEFVYRSHCRELLERVAQGRCTKQGTAAEVAVALLEASLTAPLNTSAFGLYARVWALAGFPHIDVLSDNAAHYEAIGSAQIDDLEVWARKKLAVPTRVLTGVECQGRHHGEPVICEFVKPSNTIRVA
ncbi:hypothetical protein [Nocardia nepalensis]|uniref:hypothetical protein n=1 Tax=Nocardia nepalensis TaxID=3375448 RepID=UPI003B66CDBE